MQPDVTMLVLAQGSGEGHYAMIFNQLTDIQMRMTRSIHKQDKTK